MNCKTLLGRVLTENEGLRHPNRTVHAAQKQHILAPVLKWESMKCPRRAIPSLKNPIPSMSDRDRVTSTQKPGWRVECRFHSTSKGCEAWAVIWERLFPPRHSSERMIRAKAAPESMHGQTVACICPISQSAQCSHCPACPLLSAYSLSV